MSGILEEANYFRMIMESAPPIRWGRMRPFKITFKVGSPVCITTPWINFDGLLAHLMLLDSLGPDFYITPKKLNLTPYLPKNRRMLPLKRTGQLYHASASVFTPSSLRVTQIYKRFEERWAHNLDKKKIYQGTGTFRSFMMKQPYVPCKEVTYYVHGDMEIIRELIEKYLVGLGNDVRIGFGIIRDAIFEETPADWSLVANGVAMRPIPVEFCEEYEDAAYIAWKAPYWAPQNVALCVPPGAQCVLKDDVV